MFSKNEQISAFAVYTKKRKNSETSLQLQKFQKKRSNMGNKKIKRTGNITKKKISKSKSINKRQKDPKDLSSPRTDDDISQTKDINMKMSVYNVKDKKNTEKKQLLFNSSSFFNNAEPSTTITTTAINYDTPILNLLNEDNNKSKKKVNKKSKKQNNDKSNTTENQSPKIAEMDDLFTKDPVIQTYMLFEWLIHPLNLNKFFNEHWEKKPVFIKRTDANYFKVLMSTPILDKILRDNNILFSKNIDITSYDEGVRENHNPEGRALPTIVWDYYKNGCSVRMLNPQTYLPRIHILNATLQELFGCFVGSNSYLTPPGSQGFAPHYDDIEAFILQIEGKKRWRLYHVTDPKNYLPRFPSKDLKDSDLGDPFFDEVLEAGDMLYLPRGTIHQGLTNMDCHSLHLTLSVYQKNAWCDLFEKLIPSAFEKAIESYPILREGLPVDFWRYFGLVHHDSTSNDFRSSFKFTVNLLMDKIKSYLDIDKAADEIFKNHIHDFLPPFLLKNEMICTSILDGEKMIAEGVVVNHANFKPSTKIRLIRSHCVRLVQEEDDQFRLYYSCENSKEYHEYMLQYLDIGKLFVSGIRELILRYPKFIKLADLPIEDEDNQYQMAKDLWERGIIMTESPLVSV
ncbi:PREDICTED: bifunctional lysine-specific demethylase and histidyl-hydroxylase NO66 [Polistes canadensis]|uniref:bifunctional lysine-specific demethylase and histidyl-hydroxylase NO66 n=1 Tax=Polistes canadensis TaxID=91411 RepID=UPI000718DA95|nr:PREDICTED: bifunctional lysine-specific demethylase and histidyl-hydroxylase NO66 [Polistes canadensis]